MRFRIQAGKNVVRPAEMVWSEPGAGARITNRS
jgi:hypothetical protein